MKLLSPVLLVFILSGCAKGEEKRFTGCTPANAVVRTFLSIPLSDSVDFIRWSLLFDGTKYGLKCNYGIGKQNTNGFIDGGKMIGFDGQLISQGHYLQLKHDNKALNILELNDNLLQLLNDDRSLLIGGGGWGYTLNNKNPQVSDQVNITATQTLLKDSMVFIGRTPCTGIDNRPECRKLKWSIALYANTKTNQPAGCRIRGTMFEHLPKNGSWKIVNGGNGKIVYQLTADSGESFYLLKLDENVVIFTDAKGNLLVGDHDFSYSLSRK